MAAAVAAPSRALLRAGAKRLLRGGVQDLLRPPLEGDTPGPERDFSLSSNRVRAGSELTGVLELEWGRLGPSIVLGGALRPGGAPGCE